MTVNKIFLAILSINFSLFGVNPTLSSSSSITTLNPNSNHHTRIFSLKFLSILLKLEKILFTYLQIGVPVIIILNRSSMDYRSLDYRDI
ncbi:hypothetical protein BpHYR1_035636 [Brachionus plicatilis]|uniref:Uncharacterized protein n=1 Tax=Brachionus plicatilis TaxID=10195 RepID=A0A3M7RPW8_BRAPC|nr:hypothetical protein BpHYR1_035636 [Brachionus plicatilis]